MKWTIETPAQAVKVIVGMAIATGILALWLPVAWPWFVKLLVGFCAGVFWGFMTFQSRLIGAFEPDQKKDEQASKDQQLETESGQPKS